MRVGDLKHKINNKWPYFSLPEIAWWQSWHYGSFGDLLLLDYFFATGSSVEKKL